VLATTLNLIYHAAIILHSMKSTTRILILFTIVVLSVGVAVSSGMLDKIITVVMKGEAGDTFVYIDNESVNPADTVTIDLTDESDDGDGYGDTGYVTVENLADFKLTARVDDVQVAVFYDDGDKTDFLLNMTDDGKWEFYNDSDSSGGLSSGDVRVGELTIKEGVSSTSTTFSSLDPENTFTVSDGKSRALRIEMEYMPYAPGQFTGAANYTVSFDVYVVKETY